MKWLTNNWVLKLTALAVAIALWAHVRGEVNPLEDAAFKVRLNGSMPLGWRNNSDIPETVTVRVRAPRLKLRELRGVTLPNPLAVDEPIPYNGVALRAFFEAPRPKAGEQSVPVKAVANLRDAQVLSVQPEVVELLLSPDRD